MALVSGDNIYLREVRPQDITDNYVKWLNDPEVNKYLEVRYFPNTLEGVTEFVKSKGKSSSEALYAICYKKNDLHIGNIKIGPINWIHRFADISLFIGERDYWGRGLATEAIRLVSTIAFHSLNLNKIKAGCYSGNTGSIAAFKKAGFVQEGQLKKHWLVDGRTEDQILLGLLAEDYAKIHGRV